MVSGARDLVRLLASQDKARMLTIDSGPRGRVTAWFRNEQDGHLYEIVVSPVAFPVFDVPEELRSPVNTDEPLSSDDLAAHIRQGMGPNMDSLTVVKDSHKYYDFVLHFNDRMMSKDDFIGLLRKKVMVEPFTFTLGSSDRRDTVHLRYVKT